MAGIKSYSLRAAYMAGGLVRGVLLAGVTLAGLVLTVTGVFSIALAMCFCSGLYCLFPYYKNTMPEWLLTAGAGWLAVLFWLHQGAPLNQAVFWGGAVSWLLYWVANHRHTLHYTALPVLVAAYILYASASVAPYPFPLLFACVEILAAGILLLSIHYDYKGLQTKLDAMLTHDTPEQLTLSATRLQKRLPYYKVLNPLRNMAVKKRLIAIHLHLESVLELQLKGKPIEPAVMNAAIHAIEHFITLADTSLEANSNGPEYMEKMTEEVRQMRKDEVIYTLGKYKQNQQDLMRKMASIPAALHGSLLSINQTSTALFDCLQEHPEHMAAAEAFLKKAQADALRHADTIINLTSTVKNALVPELEGPRKALAELDAAFSNMLQVCSTGKDTTTVPSPGTNGQTPLDSTESLLTPFIRMQRELNSYTPQLPQHLQAHLTSISTNTTRIMQCMREDEQDRAPGQRFLKRYLQSALNIVEKYASMAASGNQESLREITEQCNDLLPRLDAAFAHEHAQLLQNNVMDMKAELQTLDTLLKMRGE